MQTFQYAVRKDIRNNPIVRELDRSRQRELWRYVAIGAFVAGVLLYSAWQHFDLLRHGYRLEQMQQARKQEEEINRHLRLQIQVLKAPQRIERLATSELRMAQPGPGESIVLERAVPTDPPARSVVARR
jgi:cell division protein FtsL